MCHFDERSEEKSSFIAQNNIASFGQMTLFDY
jgi:hypothetical protein